MERGHRLFLEPTSQSDSSLANQVGEQRKRSNKVKTTLRIAAAATTLTGLAACGTTEKMPTPIPPQPEQPSPDFPVEQPIYEVTPEASEDDLTITEKIEMVGGNYDSMAKLVAANTVLYQDGVKEQLGLKAVRESIDTIYPSVSEEFMVGSAYLTRDVFREETNYFAEVSISSREDLYRMPPGTIFVFQQNDEENAFDEVDGAHHGHIAIVIDNDMKGNVVIGSDHHRSLDGDLMQLDNEVNVFVPIAPVEEHTEVPVAEETVSPAETFLQVAHDLKEAYNYANNGYTTHGAADTVAYYLRQKGYPEEQITAYLNRRGENGSGQTSIAGGCAQCLGWVGEVTALWSGTNEPTVTLNTYGDAAVINDIHAYGEPLRVGYYEFYPVGYGYNVLPEPGDIAVNDIHIAIVDSVLADGTVQLVESNGAVTCAVTDYRAVDRNGYVFYRVDK